MIRVAGLGAGYFARFHHEAWGRIAGAELVGVADRDPARLQGLALPVHSGLEALLDATRPDVLDIVLPPEGQLEAIRIAVDAGVSTLICQKPFCRSIAEAHAAAALADAAGVRLVVHENFRFQPWYRRMHAALQDGRLGRLHQITFRLRTGDGQGPRAYLDRQPYFQTMERFLIHETAVHWIDTFRFLMGAPDGVYADLRRLNPAIRGEDAGLLIFDHHDGRRALFDGNRHLDHATQNPRLTFGEAWAEGSEGSILLTGDGALRLRRFGASGFDTLLEPRAWPGFAGDCVHALQSHVIAHLTEGTPLENEAHDYLAVIETEAALYRSAETGARVAL